MLTVAAAAVVVTVAAGAVVAEVAAAGAVTVALQQAELVLLWLSPQEWQELGPPLL